MGQWTHLYKNARWLKRRARQLAEHPLCGLCLDQRGVVRPATVADHVTPHRGDPVLFEGALQSLCQACHSGVKQAMESGGVVRGCDAEGRPLDPGHPWNTRGGR